MSRNSKVFASPSVRPRVHSVECIKEEVRPFKVDWSAVLSDLADTSSTSEWETPDGAYITIGTDSLTNDVATASITCAQTGYATLTNKLTTTNGNVLKQIFDIQISEIQRSRLY